LGDTLKKIEKTEWGGGKGMERERSGQGTPRDAQEDVGEGEVGTTGWELLKEWGGGGGWGRGVSIRGKRSRLEFLESTRETRLEPRGLSPCVGLY